MIINEITEAGFETNQPRRKHEYLNLEHRKAWRYIFDSTKTLKAHLDVIEIGLAGRIDGLQMDQLWGYDISFEPKEHEALLNQISDIENLLTELKDEIPYER